jgi:outer membrane protein OmpA-like peptidoglycan-associated protein
MVTLLLTFFVMLLTLANVQDPEVYNKGRESFLKSLHKFGLGVLHGGEERPHFGHVKVKYFISSPDELFEGRSIDAKEEEIRRIFKNLSRSMKTMPSQIVAKKTNFSVTNIRFPPGDATLNEPAKKFLAEFCLGLQQDPDSKPVALYVLGLADDEATGREQWVLSARRAQAVADFLRDTSGSQWPVYSWGAGPGGDWVEQDSMVSRQSYILIAVLRADV